MEQYAKDASAQWKKLEANRKAKAAAKKKIKKQIAAAEKLESQLEKKEKERLAELEKEAALKAQTAWLDSGALKDISGKAIARRARRRWRSRPPRSASRTYGAPRAPARTTARG